MLDLAHPSQQRYIKSQLSVDSQTYAALWSLMRLEYNREGKARGHDVFDGLCEEGRCRATNRRPTCYFCRAVYTSQFLEGKEDAGPKHDRIRQKICELRNLFDD